MKKMILALSLAICMSAPAFAAGPGGFSGPGAQGGFSGPGAAQGAVSTVAQALTMPDDSWVTLEGYLVESLPKKERYTFKDDSGSMVVEIDHEDFMGQTVTPQTKIRIYGEVDTSMHRPTEVDVKQLTIIQ